MGCECHCCQLGRAVGDSGCSPGASIHLLSAPPSSLAAAPGKFFFFCITSDAQTIAGNHWCHQTCHSHQLCAANTGPWARAALGCCPRGTRQQKGAGRGLHRWGGLCLKCLPCSGWAGGEEGWARTGDAGPRFCLLRFNMPQSLKHPGRRDVSETRLSHSGQCGSACGAFICFQGHSPRSRRQNVLAPRGGFCCFPRRRHVPGCFCWMNSPATFAGA